ncbi:DUF58 domain-containing protein [Sphingobacterium pedocola]|uniref:DUF58 domain-containing protein n=1 Tax=Sphingobacterium pedocola TaxID=2082722 RepID=A0ABR9TC29_9SPHI|nr:DUF58 domain-containing protein [Sphingobacterium pedocola]MBE8722915.1 DUF58 domain-containing protein [Sphingobacterium pedocola]
MKIFKRLYITNLFFYILLGIVVLYVISAYIPGFRFVVDILLWGWFGVCAWDLLILYFPRNRIILQRRYPEKLSNGDANPFSLLITSSFPLMVRVNVLEEFPEQLQLRDNEFYISIKALGTKEIQFELTPVTRGTYQFGVCNALVKYIGLFKRKFVLDENRVIPCYPSFIQMRKYQLLATTDRLVELGIKRIRKIGSTLEFDHVREYVRGDEYKHMNWKASAKHSKLMVNQFQEEKSQPIYSFIDTGRAMRMPFSEMTLLDYAINATLVLSNAAILKQDRAGMLTFSKHIYNHVPAEKRNNQIRKISDVLYGVSTLFEESEFGNLYAFARQRINKRSLIFIYTNFETLDSLRRQLTYLRMLRKSHIVVVVVFKNTELVDMAREPVSKVSDIYNKIIAEKFVYEKQLIVQELNRNGLQTIYTNPADLSINSINKYLELKARGLI